MPHAMSLEVLLPVKLESFTGAGIRNFAADEKDEVGPFMLPSFIVPP